MVLFLGTQALIMARVPIAPEVLWACYGAFGSANILVYALLAGEFAPELLGRVASTTNLLMFLTIFLCQVGMGWIVDLWPRQGAVYPAISEERRVGKGCVRTCRFSGSPSH